MLARHTSTPNAGTAAIWEGWGELMISAGAARLVLVPSDEWPAPDTDEDTGTATDPSLRQRLAAALEQGLTGAQAVLQARPRGAHHDLTPGTGVLPPEIATGPRFALHGTPGGTTSCSRPGLTTSPTPPSRPARPVSMSQRGHPSRNTLWPDNHAWVLATEIDFDTTLVAGTTALVRKLVRIPGLEVLPLHPNADLTWDGDTLNQPQ